MVFNIFGQFDLLGYIHQSTQPKVDKKDQLEKSWKRRKKKKRKIFLEIHLIKNKIEKLIKAIPLKRDPVVHS